MWTRPTFWIDVFKSTRYDNFGATKKLYVKMTSMGGTRSGPATTDLCLVYKLLYFYRILVNIS